MNALPPPRQVRSITALMLGEIGDLIVTTPTLAQLRRAYPYARLHVIVRRSMADLLASNPDVDELLLYDSSSIASKLAFLARLALRNTDLWIDLHTPTFNTWNTNDEVFRRNRLFMRAAHAHFQIAFEMTPLNGRLTHPVAVPSEEALRRENIVDTTLRLMAGLGQPAGGAKRLDIAERDRAWARQTLQSLGLNGRPCIGLFFGAKQSAKVWPAAHVHSLCRALPEQFPNARFLLLGGPHEADSTRALMSSLDDSLAGCFHDLTGTGSLGRSAALIQCCAAMVATDSGPMHMADALGIPLVVLMSAHNHEGVWYPLRAVEVFRKSVPCSPCMSAQCSQNQACMTAIEPVQVLAALRRAAGPAGLAA